MRLVRRGGSVGPSFTVRQQKKLPQRLHSGASRIQSCSSEEHLIALHACSLPVCTACMWCAMQWRSGWQHTPWFALCLADWKYDWMVGILGENCKWKMLHCFNFFLMLRKKNGQINFNPQNSLGEWHIQLAKKRSVSTKLSLPHCQPDNQTVSLFHIRQMVNAQWLDRLVYLWDWHISRQPSQILKVLRSTGPVNIPALSYFLCLSLLPQELNITSTLSNNFTTDQTILYMQYIMNIHPHPAWKLSWPRLDLTACVAGYKPVN